MKKFIKLSLVTLCLSLSAAALLACKEKPPVTPAVKTELETPVIASAVYNGETQVAAVPESECYTVTTNEGGIHAGEYDVVLTLTDSAKYAWKTTDANGSATLTLKFSITQADNRIKRFTLKGWRYGEPANTPTASADFGTPVFTYSSARDGEYAATVPTETGTYFVKAAVEETADYKGAVEIKSFKIETDNPTFTTKPAAIGELKYTGKEQTLITAGEVTKGTAQYKLGEDGEWSETLPVATIAGTYTVYYKVIDGDGNAFDEASLDVSIAKTNVIPGLAVKNNGIIRCGNQAASITAEIGNSRLLDLKFSRTEDGIFDTFDKLFEGTARDLVGNGMTYYVQASVQDDDCFENAKAVISFTLNHKFVDGVCSSCNHVQTGIDYTVDGESVIVTGYSGNPSKEVYVLKTYQGKTVTSVKADSNNNLYAFKDRSDVTKIVLPDSITELKELTFFGMPNLEYLAIPGVTTLAGNGSDEYGNIFTRCDSLKTLIVKAGLTINGQHLQALSDDNAGKTNIFVAGEGTVTVNNRDKNNLFNAAYPFNGGSTAKCNTWMYDDNGNAVLAEHEYSDGVCSKCGAFGEEKTKGVKFVYDSTSDSYFVSGYSGTEETVTVIGTYNDGANGLKKVTYVAKAAFSGSSAHNSANFAICKKIKKIILPESVTDLGGWVFSECDNLEYVDARGVKNITYALSGGRPDGNNESNHNFRGSPKLTTVIIGDGYSSNICQFTTTNNTKTIDLYVYGSSVITVQKGESNADDALTGNIYYLGDGAKCGTWKFGDNGEILKGAAAHNFVDGLCSVCGEKDAMGVIYTYDSATMSYYVAKYTGSAETVTVFGTWDDGTHGEKPVTYVAFGAFSGNSHHNAANFVNCKKIKKIILPESVTDLGGWVFAECENLEYLDARGVKNIMYALSSNRPDGTNGSDNNFRSCYKLTTLIIGEGFKSNVGQFTTDGSATINLYVYGTTAITTQANDNALTGNIYYYSETESAGAWHFDENDVPTLW